MNTQGRAVSRLNQKQWRFVHELVYGRHVGNATRAYAEAFGCDPAKSAARANACRLLKKPSVQNAIAELRTNIQREDYPDGYFNRLAYLRDEAMAKGLIATALRAEMTIGRSAGFYSHPTTTR